MKNLKKIIALVMVSVFALSMLAACGGKGNSESTTAAGGEATTAAPAADGATVLNVGGILVGDETEGYTLAHMLGMEAAAEKLAGEGIQVNISYKKVIPESDAVTTNALDLIADGCTLVITNSYGHQFYVDDVVNNYPGVNVVCMTGDLAAISGAPNYFNAFTNVYESRYVSGVIAGLKVKELMDNGTLPETALDADGNVKIGYVGAYAYAEVVSGYTAFYLGIKSVLGDKVAMTVKYTNNWFSEEREAAVAEYLMDQGCVIIGQHADSTGAPAAVQARYDADNNFICYSVGYNVSMLEDAPDVALSSSSNEWGVYYETLFRAAATGAEIPQDWSRGYSEGAVCVTELGKSCAPGTAEAVAEIEGKIASGELKVFDCSTFTVNGEHLSSYNTAYGFEGNECIVTENGVTYFNESALRAAPYFDIRIDGITEIASDYND